MADIVTNLTLWPTWGFFARTISLLTITLKLFYLAPPNMVPFVFIYQTHFGRILVKSINQGSCCICFLNETSRKIENTKYLFCFKNIEMQRGYKFVPGQMFSGIKRDFFSSLARFQGVNTESWWLVPFWKGNFCDVISLKLEKPIT